MADPFIAEVRIFAGNFAPHTWALCNGQLLPISQNTALFSLLGTTYGGNGASTFSLPNLIDSVPIGQGLGPGLSDYVLGQTGGEAAVTVLNSQTPPHSHTVAVSTGEAERANPQGGYPAVPADAAYINGAVGTSSPAVVAPQGGDQPHNNLQPYLALTFIIALQGVFPPRP